MNEGKIWFTLFVQGIHVEHLFILEIICIHPFSLSLIHPNILKVEKETVDNGTADANVSAQDFPLSHKHDLW